MKQMKKIIIAAIVMLISPQFIFGQDQNARLDSFRSQVLAGYQNYFTSAGLDDNGQLRLTASGSFSQLSLSGKTEVMNVLLKAWQESLVVVQIGSQRELWGWNNENRSARLIDAWDLNPEPAPVPTEQEQSEIAKHPWFFYVGGAQQMDSNKNISGALNVRTGFFLLQNKMDLAVSLTEGLSGNIDDGSASLMTSIGAGGKYYLTLKRSDLRPNIGAELAVSFQGGGSVSFTPSALAGLSWFVGPGCLDAGLRIGSSSMMMFGYTLIPKLKSNKVLPSSWRKPGILK